VDEREWGRGRVKCEEKRGRDLVGERRRSGCCSWWEGVEGVKERRSMSWRGGQVE